MAAKKPKFPATITLTVEEEGTKDEFLMAHDADDKNFTDGQKVATYQLIEVRTCKVTTVIE